MKCILRYAFFCLVVFAVNPTYSFGEKTFPTPEIKANDSDEAVSINTSDSLSVSIGLDAGDYSGESCDWWLLVNTPSGLEYYDLASGNYTSGFSVTYQGNLFDLVSIKIFNTSNLVKNLGSNLTY